MNTEVLGLLLKKVKLPNLFKTGLIASYVVFKGFDIEGHIKRSMHNNKHA